MRLVLRHPAPVVFIAMACATCAAVLAFARPEYHGRKESRTIDFSEQTYYAPGLVNRTFAEQGIELHRSKAFSITVLSETTHQYADELQVLIGPRTGKASWGPKLEPYDERFGNVLVTYGGPD